MGKLSLLRPSSTLTLENPRNLLTSPEPSFQFTRRVQPWVHPVLYFRVIEEVVEGVKVADPEYVHVEVPRPHHPLPLVLPVHIPKALDRIRYHLLCEELVDVAKEWKANPKVGKS